MLCCMLLMLPLRAMASVPLDGLSFQEVVGRFSECGQVPGMPSAGFSFGALHARQFHCIQAQFTITRQPDRPQYLLLSMLASSEIYLDGVRVGMNGVPADTAQGERQGRIDYAVVLSPAQLAAGQHRLVLKLSTWHGSDSIREQFYNLSIEDEAPAAVSKLLPILLAGALGLVAGLFLILLLSYQRQNSWFVFFALCSTASLLLVVEAWRGAAGYEYGSHLVRLVAVQVLTGAFALLLPVYFLVAYGLPYKRLVAGAVALVVAAIASTRLHFDAKAALMFSVALVASFGINLLAARKGVPGSRAGLAVAVLSLVLWLVPGTGFFSETGFALVVVLVLFTILGQLLREFIRVREKAMLATRLENQLLRKSMQPHFLMNSLSLVGELVHQSPVQAEQFIEALGREFRMLGDYASMATIPLARELELCHNYLAIMAVRLQRPCALNVSGDSGALCLPPAVLLTCLENAFSHNRFRGELVFEFDIARGIDGATLSLAMPLAEKRNHQGRGTGSAYILNSLREAFAGKASYEAARHRDRWLATIRIPA